MTSVLTLSSTLRKLRRRPSVLEKAGVGRWGDGAVCFFLAVVYAKRDSGVKGRKHFGCESGCGGGQVGYLTERCAGGVRQQLM